MSECLMSSSGACDDLDRASILGCSGSYSSHMIERISYIASPPSIALSFEEEYPSIRRKVPGIRHPGTKSQPIDSGLYFLFRLPIPNCTGRMHRCDIPAPIKTVRGRAADENWLETNSG